MPSPPTSSSSSQRAWLLSLFSVIRHFSREIDWREVNCYCCKLYKSNDEREKLINVLISLWKSVFITKFPPSLKVPHSHFKNAMKIARMLYVMLSWLWMNSFRHTLKPKKNIHTGSILKSGLLWFSGKNLRLSGCLYPKWTLATFVCLMNSFNYLPQR